MRRALLPSSLCLLALLAGCHHEDCAPCEGPLPADPSHYAPCDQPGMASHGDLTLWARDLKGYEAATASFEWGVVEDSEWVNNDWDLLFANDRDMDVDLFRVNTVTDDRAFIVDLGPLSFCDINEAMSSLDPTPGLEGDDLVIVTRGHTYLVYTEDRDTQQLAAFFVTDHALNERVDLRWHRSASPFEYTPPSFCADL